METKARISPRKRENSLRPHPHHAAVRTKSSGPDTEATRPPFSPGGSLSASSPSFVQHLQQQQRKPGAINLPGVQPEEADEKDQAAGYPASMTRSLSTLSSSSHTHPRSPVFDTAVYDPTSDSIHIMRPHSRQNSLDAQFQDFKDRINNVKSHRTKLISAVRPQSLNLPLRSHESSRELRSAHHRELDLPARACSVRSKHASVRSFDLMAPPPGKRRSCMTQPDVPALDALVEPCDTVDADPSEALTSQIASSILREKYGVDSADAVPLKVQEAVRTCLRDVSSTVEEEHPQWGLPIYQSIKYVEADTAPAARYQKSHSEAPRGRTREPKRLVDDEDDPFAYKHRKKKKAGRSCSLQPGDVPGQALDEKKTTAWRESPTQGYPCPYRRRNPVLFNIRQREHCARRNFSDMAELKRHVRTHHRKTTAPYQCPRCRSGFAAERALSSHLTVPLERMCEPPKFTPSTSPDEGITEEMDRILADQTAKNKVHTWEELWRLLFGPETTVLEPEFLPIVEIVEAEQEFDDSADDLKHDLCDRLFQLLPDHAGDTVFFQVLAGQIQLVVEQHRAQVHRRCRQHAGIPSSQKKGPSDTTRGVETWHTKKHRSTSSRYSVSAAAATAATAGRHASQSSIHRFSPPLPRRSHTAAASQPTCTKMTTTTTTTVSSAPAPASSSSSVYSQRSSLRSSSSSHSSSSSRPQTRSSGTSVVSHSNISAAAMHEDSPRLPFREWVHGIKIHNEEEEQMAQTPSSPGPRDSGLALPCDTCCTDPCQCGDVGGSYADQLSAFMTPAVGGTSGKHQQQPPVAGVNAYYGEMLTPAQPEMYEAGSGSMDWAARYSMSLLSAGGGGGGPLTSRSSQQRRVVSAEKAA